MREKDPSIFLDEKIQKRVSEKEGSRYRDTKMVERTGEDEFGLQEETRESSCPNSAFLAKMERPQDIPQVERNRLLPGKTCEIAIDL